MADIFISYASEDHSRAEAVANALGALGWSVWWDDHIAPGKRFDKVIAAELEKARCVVVLWSATSVQKDWVREEAMAGKQRDVLLPVLIEDVPLPFGFSLVQTANLVGWALGRTDREFDALVASIERLAPRPQARSEPLPSEAEWQDLLATMRERGVAAVIGQRLVVDANGRPLYGRVAGRLLRMYKVEPPEAGLTPSRELSEAEGLLDGKARRQNLYIDIARILGELLTAGTPIPDPLQQLAGIADINLFMTLTPDDLLARALRSQGRTVSEVVHSPRLPTSESNDLASDGGPGGVTVFYALGKSRAAPLYAIGEQDVEHYVDNIQSKGSHAPIRLLDELKHRNLLFIGAGFPGWLTRRIARTLMRFTGARTALDDQGAERLGAFYMRQDDEGVALRWPGPPGDFVAELNRRWTAEQAMAAADAAAAAAAGTRPVPRGVMFFISYSRHADLAAAKALDLALRSLGAGDDDVWFDRADAEPGDALQQQIKRGIGSCRYFLALVSQAATARREDSVFREWRAATERAREIDGAFLLPIIVDVEYLPASYGQGVMPEWNGLHFGHAPGGHPDATLLNQLKRMLREARASA